MFKIDETTKQLVLDGTYTKQELKDQRASLEYWRDQETYKERMNWKNYNYWGDCIRVIDARLAILEDLI